MKIDYSLHLHRLSEGKELLVLPFYEEGKVPRAAFPFPLTEPVQALIASGDFLGKEEELLILYPSSSNEVRIILVGLGVEKGCGDERFRQAGGLVAKLLKQKGWDSIALPFSHAGFMEGLLLASYGFDLFKTEKEGVHYRLKRICLPQGDALLKSHLDRILPIVEAVNYTRDLVNGNADTIHADRLVAEAEKLARAHSLKIEILRQKELEKEKMELLLAVNRAAIREPALVLLEYRGNPKSEECTAVIGKGIVYDTGGLSLKLQGMETMKCDMAGAATVLGLLKAAATLSLKTNLVGVLAIAENSIGPNSFKLGDVYRGRNGTTVEITSTDAEGRLVLADAFSYVQDTRSITAAIDLATLTGAVVIALGEEFAALYSNEETLASRLLAAGEVTGDYLWRMPLRKAYREMIKSKIADLKNSSGRKASSSTAAAFVQVFVKKNLPWAHLDIAGTAYVDEPRGYHSSHATGFGVRLLVEYFTSTQANTYATYKNDEKRKAKHSASPASVDRSRSKTLKSQEKPNNTKKRKR